MRSLSLWNLLALCALVLVACDGAAPNPVPTLVPVLAQPATPSSAPTVDASAFVPEGARLVSALEADANGDGVAELIVCYLQGGVGRALVLRRDGSAVFPLSAPAGSALFRERLTSLSVRDVTGDGKPEIVLEGVLEGGAAAVHVFQWNGRAYVTLLSLRGEQGIASDDPQGNGVLEFTALQTLFQRSAIFRAATAEWTGASYLVRSEVAFVFGAPALSRYPEETALAYYRHWQRREPQAMWALLGGAARAEIALADLEARTRNAESVRVEQLRVGEESESAAQVTVEVRLGASGAESAETHVWRLERAADGRWELAERVR